MSSPVLILTSYTVNGNKKFGNYPIWIKGISQCCIDPSGKLTINPIIVKQPK